MFFRHGIRQIRTGWADGPAYITQCPIQPGQSYVYNFTVTGQRGTLWWHAHILWLRATVHGAIVILPKPGVPYPFPAPDKEVVVLLGEKLCTKFYYASNETWTIDLLLSSRADTDNVFLIFVGEWWKSDVEAVIKEATKSGLAPNVSDAHTINGHPGPVSTCLTQSRYL